MDCIRFVLHFVWDFYIISSPLCIMCHKSKTRGVRDDVVYCDLCFAKNKAMCLSKICAYFLVFVAENNLYHYGSCLVFISSIIPYPYYYILCWLFFISKEVVLCKIIMTLPNYQLLFYKFRCLYKILFQILQLESDLNVWKWFIKLHGWQNIYCKLHIMSLDHEWLW